MQKSTPAGPWRTVSPPKAASMAALTVRVAPKLLCERQFVRIKDPPQTISRAPLATAAISAFRPTTTQADYPRLWCRACTRAVLTDSAHPRQYSASEQCCLGKWNIRPSVFTQDRRLTTGVFGKNRKTPV